MFKKILLGSFFTFCLSVLFAQSPGLIVRPATGHVSTILNPTAPLAYASASTSGFVNNDIAESKIPFIIVPPMLIEPTGDVATGPNGGFTDIVQTVDGSGFYIAKSTTNLLFRLRIGAIISGAKGYSVLIDTDGKMGNSGPYADPTYVAATNTSNGNPGFEYEVVFRTGFGVTVYNVDNGSPVFIKTYSLATHSQISVALSTDGNNADYFYDWYVELADIGNPASVRLAATTVTSPTSALQGSRSDIYGIDDRNYKNAASAWEAVINAQPSISITNFPTGTIGATCTSAPLLHSPIIIGSSVNVTGLWTRLDASKPNTATIRLYKTGIGEIGSITATSGVQWTITVPLIVAGEVFYTMAQSNGESQCLQSNSVTAGCASIPAAPVVSCASTKGLSGTLPNGASILIYELSTASATPTLLTTNLVVSGTNWNYYGSNGTSSNACSGSQGIFNTGTTLMFITSLNGCRSATIIGCITGNNGTSTLSTIASNDLLITNPIYGFNTTVSGTSATGLTSGQVLRLFVNDVFISGYTVASATNNFSFSNVTLKTGDVLKVYRQTSGSCMTVSASRTVSCYTAPPNITSSNILPTATSITGTSVYPGATVTLFKNTSTQLGTATVGNDGSWVVSVSGLVANDVIHATQVISGCTSASSTTRIVFSPATICPTITGSYTENSTSATGGLSATFTGTIRLYLDGTLIGRANVTSANSWTINPFTIDGFTYTLYNGGLLLVTAQASGQAESTNACAGSTATVTCTVPSTPTVSPSNQTIQFGQSTTLSVENVQADVWYSLVGSTGKTYGTSLYRTSNSNFTFNTQTFTTEGEHLLQIKADKLTGCAPSLAAARIFVEAAVLSVRFLDVNVTRKQVVNLVQWTVTDEDNVSYYEIQRSKNCRDFEMIGRVSYQQGVANQRNYDFSDQDVSGSRVCYRIAEVDNNGRIKYSKIVSIQADQRNNYMVYPNPAKDQAQFRFTSTNEGVADLYLINYSGQKLLKTTITLRKGINIISIPDLDKFSSGNYILKLQGGGHLVTLPLQIKK
jgi:hypothetical protein